MILTEMIQVGPEGEKVDRLVYITKWEKTIKQIIDEKGKITKLGGPYAGMDRFEARKKIVEKLQELGLIEKITAYPTRIPHCYRCETEYGRIYATFVNGDYGAHRWPQLKVWDLTFGMNELKDNYDMLIAHGKRRGLL